jgi:hypothetical protein
MATCDLVVEALVGLRFTRHHVPLALSGGLSRTGSCFDSRPNFRAATTLATQVKRRIFSLIAG